MAEMLAMFAFVSVTATFAGFDFFFKLAFADGYKHMTFCNSSGQLQIWSLVGGGADVEDQEAS